MAQTGVDAPVRAGGVRRVPVLDVARIHRLRDEHGEAGTRLLELFVRTTPALIAELRGALAAGDDAEAAFARTRTAITEAIR